MSIALMSLAFKTKTQSSRKLVLLALCDSANDQGECYPSILTLAEKCSLSERAIQSAISGLETDGFVRRELRAGRATVYWCTPANGAPPQTVHPAAAAPQGCKPCTPADSAPPQTAHPTPANGAPAPANGAPITITQTPKNQIQKTKSAPVGVSSDLLIEAGFDEATALEFIAHKARLKAPLTARAWADHLAESRKAGWPPMAAAVKVMARNWKGFEAAYVANEQRTGQASYLAEKQAEMAKWIKGTSLDQTIEQEIDHAPQFALR